MELFLEKRRKLYQWGDYDIGEITTSLDCRHYGVFQSRNRTCFLAKQNKKQIPEFVINSKYYKNGLIRHAMKYLVMSRYNLLWNWAR